MPDDPKILISVISIKVTSGFNKLANVKRRLRRLSQRKPAANFLCLYLFLYVFNHDAEMNFSHKGVELVSHFFTNFLPILCADTDVNQETQIMILMVLYEIYTTDIRRMSKNMTVYTHRKAAKASPSNVDWEIGAIMSWFSSRVGGVYLVWGHVEHWDLFGRSREYSNLYIYIYQYINIYLYIYISIYLY